MVWGGGGGAFQMDKRERHSGWGKAERGRDRPGELRQESWVGSKFAEWVSE